VKAMAALSWPEKQPACGGQLRRKRRVAKKWLRLKLEEINGEGWLRRKSEAESIFRLMKVIPRNERSSASEAKRISYNTKKAKISISSIGSINLSSKIVAGGWLLAI